MPNTTPVVFIVDDNSAVRQSLEALLGAAGWQPESFASVEDFLRRPRVDVPSCLLLDIDLPGLDGLSLQRRLAAERIDLPVIILTGHGDIPMTVQAMKAGAVALLAKPLADDMVLSAVREGIDRSRELLIREEALRELRTRHDSLSLREREVMGLVVAGLLNKQVGGRLGISEITVKAHRGKVMRKMEAGSLPDLVKMATSLQLPAVAAEVWRSFRPFQVLAGNAWQDAGGSRLLATARVG